MSADCPFCAQPLPAQALVCSSCARDVTIPQSLLDERDDLVRKRAAVKDALANAKAELETLRRRRRILLRRH